ncbi:MAG: transglycosylase domain-containing protein [Actinomycetes bacterium]
MRFLRALPGLLATVLIGGLALGLCLAAIFPGFGIIASATRYSTDLVTNLRALSERSVILDSAGNEIGQLGIENRSNVTLDQVSPNIINAVIATEDKTFWTNSGVDLPSVARAFLKNLSAGQIAQGGSTISQQLVKNRILSSKRDLNRKVREILLAVQLNKDYSKREILTQYLNTVYFGQGAYGVKSAVERLLLRPDPKSPFGGVSGPALKDVSIADAAMLAGLISSPEAYNPFTHADLTKERRSFVLDQMVKEKYITQAEADDARNVPIPTVVPAEDLRPRDSWSETVQTRLFNDPRYAVLGKDAAARKEAVLRGGLEIYTTLDPTAQNNALDAINSTVPPDKAGFTAALVAMDPTTGAVRSMVAGAGFDSSQYNIATTYPGRQAGSTWKVITLAAAMQSHYSSLDTVDGSSPCAFGDLGQTVNAEEGEGTMTLRSATAGSVNCAFARIELSLGFPKVIDMAKKMGITQSTLKPILTLTLGTIEATPLEMATVDSTIANLGVHHDPYFIEKIVNSEGITIYQEAHPGLRALDDDSAKCQVSIMQGVVTGGTGTGAAVPGWQVAGKTGTTDNRADAWFIGMVPTLTAVVWHGNPSGRVPGAGFGGNIPATIFRKFMTAQLANQTPVGWDAPPAWCDAPGQFIAPAGRVSIPPGFEMQNGALVPVTTTPPTVIVNRPTLPPTTRPIVTTPRPTIPATTTTRPPSTTTTRTP